MKKRTLIAAARLTVVAGFGVATAVLGEDLSKFPASTQTGLTYAKDIQPLFKASCYGCHGPDVARPKGGLRLDSLEAVLKGGKDGKVIEPGKSADSDLVISVAQLGDHPMPQKPRGRRGGGGPGGTNAPNAGMPPSGGGPGPGGPGGPGGGPPGPPAKPFTAEEVGLIRAWVDQGAK